MRWLDLLPGRRLGLLAQFNNQLTCVLRLLIGFTSPTLWHIGISRRVVLGITSVTPAQVWRKFRRMYMATNKKCLHFKMYIILFLLHYFTEISMVKTVALQRWVNYDLRIINNSGMRHALTRLAVPGFHHVICNNTSFHEPSDSCKYTLCDQLWKRNKINKRLCFPRCKCQTILTHTHIHVWLLSCNKCIIKHF